MSNPNQFYKFSFFNFFHFKMFFGVYFNFDFYIFIISFSFFQSLFFSIFSGCFWMNNSAFFFSFDALLSLIFVFVVLFLVSFPSSFSFSELLVIQKQNDLFKVWSIKGFDSADVAFALGNNSFVFFDEIPETFSSKKSISSCSYIFVNSSRKKICLITKLE